MISFLALVCLLDLPDLTADFLLGLSVFLLDDLGLDTGLLVSLLGVLLDFLPCLLTSLAFLDELLFFEDDLLEFLPV